jgi:hypothetical protein
MILLDKFVFFATDNFYMLYNVLNTYLPNHGFEGGSFFTNSYFQNHTS